MLEIQREMGKRFRRHFKKEDINMTNKDVKSGSAFLIIGGMQNNTVERHIK